MNLGDLAAMYSADPYIGWSLSDRFQMLAFEAKLSNLPCSLISAIWEAQNYLSWIDSTDGQPNPRLERESRAPTCGNTLGAFVRENIEVGFRKALDSHGLWVPVRGSR